MKFKVDLKEFGRQAMNFLNISRPSSRQSTSINLCQWIRTLITLCRFKLTKRRLKWIGSHRSGHKRWRLVLGPTYLIAYRRHQDTNHALQVQIYKETPRVDWMKEIGTLRMGVSSWSNLPDSLSYNWLTSGNSSHSAGSNPRNDTSSRLVATNYDTNLG